MSKLVNVIALHLERYDEALANAGDAIGNGNGPMASAYSLSADSAMQALKCVMSDNALTAAASLVALNRFANDVLAVFGNGGALACDDSELRIRIEAIVSKAQLALMA